MWGWGAYQALLSNEMEPLIRISQDDLTSPPDDWEVKPLTDAISRFPCYTRDCHAHFCSHLKALHSGAELVRLVRDQGLGNDGSEMMVFE